VLRIDDDALVVEPMPEPIVVLTPLIVVFSLSFVNSPFVSVIWVKLEKVCFEIGSILLSLDGIAVGVLTSLSIDVKEWLEVAVDTESDFFLDGYSPGFIAVGKVLIVGFLNFIYYF
jgi:hypothetical protein